MIAAVLIVLGGRPGTGKTTVGQALARRLQAVFLRIDSIERPMLDAGWAVEGVGYEAAHAIAADNLRLGLSVVADSVNPWPLTRNAWRGVAANAGARCVEVEFVCSDAQEHRRRVEQRRAAEPERGWPSWQEVLDRDYRPWEGERLVVDTTVLMPGEAVERILARVSAVGVVPFLT